jgi:cobalamin synthase
MTMKKGFGDNIWRDEDAHLVNVFFPNFADSVPKATRRAVRFTASTALIIIISLVAILAIAKLLEWPTQFLFVLAPAIAVAALLMSWLFRRTVTAQSQSISTHNFYKPAACMSMTFILPVLILTLLPLFLPDQYLTAGFSFSANNFFALVLAGGMIFAATTRYFRRLSQI